MVTSIVLLSIVVGSSFSAPALGLPAKCSISLSTATATAVPPYFVKDAAVAENKVVLNIYYYDDLIIPLNSSIVVSSGRCKCKPGSIDEKMMRVQYLTFTICSTGEKKAGAYHYIIKVSLGA